MRIKDRVALITGAGQGIGRATALRLAEDGAHVMVVDISPEQGQETARLVRDMGRDADIAVADVSVTEAVEAAVKQALDRFGRVDILVNNAGIVRDSRLKDMTDDQWDRVIAVDLRASFLTSRAVLPSMIQNKHGRIINISARNFLGNFGQTNYAAAKAGLVGLSKSLALEHARDGITVNVVAPGQVETPAAKEFMERAPEVMEKFMKANPMRRFAQPRELANAILFFADDESSFITGQVLFVCGGWSIGAQLY